MKKIILLNACLILLGLSGISQFSPKTHLLSGGISLGSYGRYGHEWNETLNYDEGFSLPVWLQYETGIPDSWDFQDYNPYFSLGGYLGFGVQKFSNHNLQGVKVYRDYRYISFGGLAAFHYVPLLKDLDIALDPEKFDFYVSMKLGFVSERLLANLNENPLDFTENKKSKLNLSLAPQLGFRYFFQPRMAGMVELGYFNMSLLSIGLSYRFQ